MLKGKHILLGVTGSIAAYKAAILVRALVKEGAEVKIIMTPLAKEFITPLTLATLAKSPILVDFFDPENGNWNSHVDLGLWADLYLIAPATANTMGKMAHAIADNLLITSYLSARCPVFLAPAMDLDMFMHPANTDNMELLRKRGVHFVDPGNGELASGLIGKGRMAEPEEIVAAIKDFFRQSSELKGKRILITTGPTFEAIDPVRFIGNHSSGKMGQAIALEIAKRGGMVELISGPVSLETTHPNINVTKVRSAAQMYEACVALFPDVDGAIMAAAVADFTPVSVETSKVKRGKENYTIELQPTQDIAAELGKMKREKQFLIGFALETTDEESNAQQKLKKKNLDFIVLNSLNDEGAGFQHDTNKITIIDRSGEKTAYELKPKTEVARDIIDRLINYSTKE